MPRSYAHTKRRYRVDKDEFLRIYESQSRLCPISLVPLRIGRDDPEEYGQVSVVDHCHDSGLVRGILSSEINRALGLFGHDPDALRRAAAYIETHRRNHEQATGKTK